MRPTAAIICLTLFVTSLATAAQPKTAAVDGGCDPHQLGCNAPSAKATAAETDGSCLNEAGVKKAREYVRQCIEVSPATHPPCNVSNPCSLIVDEIRRGCGFLTSDAPAYCADYAVDGQRP